jgi:DNA-binding IclR family transcriptional regulator
LSRILDMHRTTLLRLLTTLQMRGFVARDYATDRYRLGLGVLSLSGVVLHNLDIR